MPSNLSPPPKLLLELEELELGDNRETQVYADALKKRFSRVRVRRIGDLPLTFQATFKTVEAAKEAEEWLEND